MNGILIVLAVGAQVSQRAVLPPCRAKVSNSMPKIYFKHFQILLKEEPSLVQLSVQIVAQETCYLKIR